MDNVALNVAFTYLRQKKAIHIQLIQFNYDWHTLVLPKQQDLASLLFDLTGLTIQEKLCEFTKSICAQNHLLKFNYMYMCIIIMKEFSIGKTKRHL